MAGVCDGDVRFLFGTNGFGIWRAGHGLSFGVCWCGNGDCGVMKSGGDGPTLLGG